MLRTLVISCIVGLGGFYIGANGIPFVRIETPWAIGIYEGSTPFDLQFPSDHSNPVLTAADITDVAAKFVADPFMLRKERLWYMFFEILNADTNQGDIGYAQSLNGFAWSYGKVILDEPFHLSYPQVLEWQGEYYMVPESHNARSVRLYRAEAFPENWTFVANLLEDVDYVDPTVFQYDRKWWLFAAKAAPNENLLYLYHADTIVGPWTGHPKNPVVQGSVHTARPGGRVLQWDDRLFRFAQDLRYPGGPAVRALEVAELTITNYMEKEVGEEPFLGPSASGWNAHGMHHIDAHEVSRDAWIAAVDGMSKRLVYGLGY